MSYEPTVWKDGDLVTSAKLNKMEQGIYNNGVINATEENGVITLDKTWQEIWDNNYTLIPLTFIDEMSGNIKIFYQIGSMFTDTHTINVHNDQGMSLTFEAEDANSYPTYNSNQNLSL